jgi:tRNA(Ile)-lysidine synthase
MSMFPKNPLENAITAFWLRHMLPAGHKLVIGVSGGADSMALLHVLWENRESLAIGGLVCAHLNHQLRGAESDGDRDFVERYCTERGIDFHSGSADIAAHAAAQKRGIEETARNIRAEYLRSVLEISGSSVFLTAHNANDNAETVLLHLLRGSGLTGLSGMNEISGRHWRPLLSVTRSEINEYLTVKNIPHREDGSNTDKRYTRNKIRHQLLPLMEEFNPQIREALNRLADIAGSDDNCLHEAAVKIVYTDGTGCKYCLKTELETSHPAIAARALRLLCPEDKQPPYFHTKDMLAAVKRNSAAELPGRLRMVCKKGKVWVVDM